MLEPGALMHGKTVTQQGVGRSWWAPILSNLPQDGSDKEAESSSSFHLSEAFSSHSKETSKNDKKVLKRRPRKDTKKNIKQQNDIKPDLKFGAIAIGDTLASDRNTHANSPSDKQGQKEHCSVVDLKVPFQSDIFSLHHLKQTERLKRYQEVEAPLSFRRKSLCGEGKRERQLLLKKVEAVNFIGEEQPLDVQHQKSPTQSSCITAPDHTNRPIHENLTHGSGPAFSWKAIHSPPSPRLCHTHRRKSYPCKEYPDLVLSSKQLSSQAPSSQTQLNAYHCIQDQMQTVRPLLRYSHRHGSAGHCSRTDECVPCFSDTTQIQSSSLVLDCEQGLWNGQSIRHSIALNRELPPLEGLSGSQVERRDAPLQAQGHFIVRYPYKSCDQKRSSGRVTRGSTTSLPSRHKKEGNCYPDPLVGGLPSYRKRLAQMAALVTETMQSEREKAFKMKSKKATPSTPKSNNNGSLGSVL